MSHTTLKKFEDLAHSNELIGLDWLGGISTNFDEKDNPLIECIFSPVREAIVDGSKKLLLPTPKKQFSAGIAVGFLPSLFIGKFYKNGKPIKDKSMSRETVYFEIDTSDLNQIYETNLHDLYKNSAEKNSIEILLSSTAAKSGIKILSGKLTSNGPQSRRPSSAALSTDKYKIVIHEMEMIRYYMTNSEHSCKLVMTGAFQDENFYTQVVNRNYEEPGFYTQLGGHRFVYRHGYRNSDAPILGRILFEPNNIALQAVQRIHKTISRDLINSVNSSFGYPRTNFPFEGSTRLKLAGRRFSIGKQWYFQVHRILDCTYPFPFKRLSYCDEIEQGGNPPPDDAKTAFSNIKTHDRGPAHTNSDLGNSVSNHPPSISAESLEADLGTRTYTGLNNVTLVREKLRNSTHKTQPRINRDIDTLVNASTGRGTFGQSSAVRQKIEESIFRPSQLTPSLQNFLTAVNGLKTLEKNWHIKTIGIGVFIDEKDATFSFFPAVHCDKQARYRQFSYMDPKKKISRRVICVEVGIEDKYFYLFEAQRRPRDSVKEDDGNEHKETLPILLLHSPGYASHEGKDFLKIIEQTVIEKTWPKANQIIPFIRDDMHHCSIDDSIDNYTKRLEQFLYSNLP